MIWPRSNNKVTIPTQGDLEKGSVETATQPTQLLFSVLSHPTKTQKLCYLSVFTRRALNINQLQKHDETIGNTMKTHKCKQQQRPF